MSSAARDTFDPGANAELLAIDGLLLELGRGGEGHDEAFVGRVMTVLERPSSASITRPSAAKIRAAASARRASSRLRRKRSRARSILRYVVAPLAAAAAVMIAAHFFNVQMIDDTEKALCAEIIDLDGPAEIVGPRGAVRPARRRESVRIGDSLVTGAGAALEIRYPDGSTVRLDGDSEIALGRDATAKRVHLKSGELTAEVSEQPLGQAMVLTTPNASATVLGTRFTLSAAPGRTRLEVERGAVRLRRDSDGQAVEVTAGFYALAADGEDLALHRIGEPIAAVEPTPEPEPEPAPAPEPELPEVVGFTLVDARNGRPIAGSERLADGAVLQLAKLPTRELNVLAEVRGRTGSVTFFLNGKLVNTEKQPPFGMMLDDPETGGEYRSWTPTAGRYTLKATPYTGGAADHKRPGTGKAGRSLEIRFRVTDR